MKKLLLICNKKKAEEMLARELCPSREYLYFLYIAPSGQLVLCYGWLDDFGNQFEHRPVYPNDKEVNYKGVVFSYYQWNFYLDQLKRVNTLINPNI